MEQRDFSQGPPPEFYLVPTQRNSFQSFFRHRSAPVSTPSAQSSTEPYVTSPTQPTRVHNLLSTSADSQLQAQEYVRKVSEEHELYVQQLREFMNIVRDCIIPSDRIRRLEVLGSGAYAEVKRAVLYGPQTNELVVIKHVHRPCREKLLEMLVLRELQHGRIIRFIGVLALENDADLVYEYVPGGSLCGLLQSTVPMSDRLKFTVLLQVAMGMQHVHSRGIIHRDLNSKNILLDLQGNAKIADFGLSRFIPGRESQAVEYLKQVADQSWYQAGGSYQPRRTTGLQRSSTLTTEIGTPQYIAPEVIQGPGYNEKCDVYSFGVVVWEIFARRPAWENVSNSILFDLVLKGHRPQKTEEHLRFPIVCSLLDNCLHYDPAQRPSFLQIAYELMQLTGLEG